ncbi:MAG: hypothetical protein P1V34_01685 [Alphaproteobacteria bacterium]|nr:hypothetical protein [Alphaproteobacteria bacterium]
MKGTLTFSTILRKNSAVKRRFFAGIGCGVLLAFGGVPFHEALVLPSVAYAQQQVNVIEIKGFRRDSFRVADKDAQRPSISKTKADFVLPQSFAEEDEKNGLYPLVDPQGELFYLHPKYAILNRKTCDLGPAEVAQLRNYATSGARPPC